MSALFDFVPLAAELEGVGLVWQPEIGDEVSERNKQESVSILVDTHGLTPKELRQSFIWLPTVEQIMMQFEARQAILFHAGLELTETNFCYKAVLRAPVGPIESSAESLRVALGKALKHLLLFSNSDSTLH